MATAQTAVSSGTTPGSGPQGTASGPSAAPGDRKLYEDARDSPRSRSGMADAGSQGSGSIKRRLEERDEGIRYGSPSHHSPQPRASSARIPPHEDVRASPGSRLGRNGGHPAYSSPYDEDAKRRRVEERYQPPPPGTGAVGDYEYGGEEHEDMRYMRAPRPSNGRYSPAEGPPPLPHPSSSEQRRPSLMDGEYDAGVPLARRRGDAAQAKASRLHIDTGSAAAGDAPPSRQSSTYQPSPGRATTVAKSAPPQKMTFSDRGGDAPPFDPRGEPPPPRYHPAPAHGGYSRQPGPPPGHFVDERGGYISPPLRGPPPPGAHSQGHPPPPPPQAALLAYRRTIRCPLVLLG
ncbi:hypothetical protein FA10DRAFT_158549 [Acaromyces ingoldii]|uniref:Uncharacterized protein n=1 Tax=Acaromyces ingoldii TaxID=215250 RepID=A0A316YGK8_9BASI|nr:hypothetical protein FA10DRAFT_158549 [Acaromyces ingoldii]PWN88261.1 hypothetical protein FA10DRAFT_158549 [Acaromyces ingoldii]